MKTTFKGSSLRILFTKYVTTEGEGEDTPAGGDGEGGTPLAGESPAGDSPGTPLAGEQPSWMDALEIPEEGREAYKDLTNEQVREKLNGPVAPEKYDFTLPEGMAEDAVDKDVFAGFTGKLGELGQKHGLSQEAMNEISQMAVQTDVDRNAGPGAVEAGKEVFNSELDAWKKEMGATKSQELITGANRARVGFMTPGFAKLLDDTGLGNSPDVIQTFAAISAVIGEDSMPKPAHGTSQPGDDREQKLNSLYPSMKK